MYMKLLIFLCLVCGLSTVALAEETDQNIYEGTLENRVNALSTIQPGLGVVMHEFGSRMAATYWAANGGNWGLAQYELKELLEAQEVAEVTRPKRAEMLKAFEQGNLLPLNATVEKKDIKEFNRRFSAVVNACNACHTALGYGFIEYQVPAQSNHDILNFSLKTEPEYNETEEPK